MCKWSTTRCDGQDHILICDHRELTDSSLCGMSCMNPPFGAEHNPTIPCHECSYNNLANVIQGYAARIRELRDLIADGRHSHTISAQDIDDGEQEIANIEAWVRGEAGRELFRLDEVLNEAARWRRMDGCGFVIELDDGGDGDVDEDEGYENVEEIEEPLAEWLALRGLGGPRMIER